jgi:hypothetical protein
MCHNVALFAGHYLVAFEAANNPVRRLFEIFKAHCLALAACRNNRGFVANVGNVGPCEPGSLRREVK